MKNLTTLFLVICSLTTYSQKLSINNARALEGASVKFILTLDAATSPFVVEVKFTDNEAKGAATKSKKYKLETNDYSNVKQYIAFDGTAGESKDFYVPTYQDSDRSEGDERFTVNLSTNSGAVTVPGSVVGVIEDVPCRYCPSSSFLYNAEQFRIEFFGDGSLQNSLDKGTDIAANTGVGVVAKKYFKNLPGQKFGPWYRVDLAAIINVASTIDTLIADFDASNAITNQRAFGSSVLTPLSTGDAVNLSLLLYNKETWLGLVSGIEFQYLGSNRNWQFTNTEIFNVNTSFIKFTLFHDFVNYDKSSIGIHCTSKKIPEDVLFPSIGVLMQLPNFRVIGSIV